MLIPLQTECRIQYTPSTPQSTKAFQGEMIITHYIQMARILIVIFQIFRIRAQIRKRREIRIVGKRVFERDVGKHSVFAM